MKSDLQIQHDVLAELDREQQGAAGTVGVEVHHGVVKLAGSVSDSAIRKTVEFAALRVDGVTSVVMDVDVAVAAPQSRSVATRAARLE
ncbi:MAG TPA: BON domain-containing protein [Steroidobacteraceae bacterium]|nr:BON domain-containing protein [Steroidobacteraceae bacterium]